MKKSKILGIAAVGSSIVGTATCSMINGIIYSDITTRKRLPVICNLLVGVGVSVMNLGMIVLWNEKISAPIDDLRYDAEKKEELEESVKVEN
jgi:hypothetical protein